MTASAFPYIGELSIKDPPLSNNVRSTSLSVPKRTRRRRRLAKSRIRRREAAPPSTGQRVSAWPVSRSIPRSAARVELVARVEVAVHQFQIRSNDRDRFLHVSAFAIEEGREETDLRLEATAHETLEVLAPARKRDAEGP
jgi:hypothetical protein